MLSIICDSPNYHLLIELEENDKAVVWVKVKSMSFVIYYSSGSYVFFCEKSNI